MDSMVERGGMVSNSMVGNSMVGLGMVNNSMAMVRISMVDSMRHGDGVSVLVEDGLGEVGVLQGVGVQFVE